MGRIRTRRSSLPGEPKNPLSLFVAAGWFCSIGLFVLAVVIWCIPTPRLSGDVVQGRVVNPATQKLPFGPDAAFAMLRVHVLPEGNPVQFWNTFFPKEGLALETEEGTIQVKPPRWGRWRNETGFRWSAELEMRKFQSLEGLPKVSETPGWREAKTDGGFLVSAKPLFPGDWVVLENPGKEDAVLWRGTIESLSRGHRVASRISGGILLLFSMGIGWATVLFTRGRGAIAGRKSSNSGSL